MRLFLAIELPEEVRRYLSSLAATMYQRVGFGASWTRVENLHITVKFLGDVPEPAIPELCEALDGITADPIPRAAADHVSFFPQRGPAHVLAVGIGPDASLRRLREQIDEVCESLGYPRERREYHPHITVGRSREGIHAWRRSVEESWRIRLPSPPFDLRTFALMQSRLLPAGPQYTRIASFELRRN